MISTLFKRNIFHSIYKNLGVIHNSHLMFFLTHGSFSEVYFNDEPR